MCPQLIFRAARSIAPVLVLTLAGESVRAQSTESAPTLDPSVDHALKSEVHERLTSARLTNRTGERLKPGRITRLFEGLHVRFKAFERDSGGDLALGFEYDYAKSLTAASDENSSLDFVAEGNVAFERSLNPDSFLATTLRARWFGTHEFGEKRGGTRSEVAGDLPAPADAQVAAFNAERMPSADALASGSSGAASERAAFMHLRESYLRDVKRRMTPELVWDFDLHATLESNQDFSSRQKVFGPAFSGRFVSWNPDAKLSRLNVFDFPTAALRWLVGQDEGFRPSGEAYPMIRLGFDMVDASDDDARSALTDDDSLFRARVEAGLKSPLLDLDGETLCVSVDWRFYQEIDASAPVRSADYDSFDQFQVRLDLPSNWSLSYSAGRMPLDAHDDSTFALGFDVQF